jgi:lysophospholipase L1-like esterase
VKTPRLRALLAMTAQVAGVLLVSLVLLEVVLRGLGGFLPEELQQMMRATPRHMGVAHAYIGHLHTPNNTFVISGRDFRAVSHTDGLGFRNSWPWPARAEIVAVGDSLTFGYGVADSEAWPAILARMMPSERVINLGLIGAGPQQYLRLYETFGIPLRPAVLLVGLFVGNDFWDAGIFDRWERLGVGGNYMVWRDFGRPGTSADRPATPGARVKTLLVSTAYKIAEYSQVVNLMRVMWQTARSTETKEFRFADGSRLLLSPDRLVASSEEGRPGRREFQVTLEAFERIQQLARANGARLVVIFQPSKEEVYLPLLDHVTLDPGRPLREAFQRLGIDYLDLGPVFRERAAAGQRLFFAVDGHPNAAGYALIAEAVYHELERRR